MIFVMIFFPIELRPCSSTVVSKLINRVLGDSSRGDEGGVTVTDGVERDESLCLEEKVTMSSIMIIDMQQRSVNM